MQTVEAICVEKFHVFPFDFVDSELPVLHLAVVCETFKKERLPGLGLVASD